MLHKENSVNYSLSFIPLSPYVFISTDFQAFTSSSQATLPTYISSKTFSCLDFLSGHYSDWICSDWQENCLFEKTKTCLSSHQAVSSLAQGGTASRPNMEREIMTDWLMLDSSMCGQHDIRPPSKNAPKKTHQCPIFTSSQSECRADLTMTKLRVCE